MGKAILEMRIYKRGGCYQMRGECAFDPGSLNPMALPLGQDWGGGAWLQVPPDLPERRGGRRGQLHLQVPCGRVPRLDWNRLQQAVRNVPGGPQLWQPGRCKELCRGQHVRVPALEGCLPQHRSMLPHPLRRGVLPVRAQLRLQREFMQVRPSFQRRRTLASERHPVRRILRPCRNSKHAEKPCSRDRESCRDPEGALMARGGREESRSLEQDLADDTRRVPKGPGPLAYRHKCSSSSSSSRKKKS